MKKMFKLRKLFFGLLALNFLLVAVTPWLIRGSLFGVTEELLETIIIIILLIFAYSLSFLYVREVGRLRRYQVNLEDRLQDTFKYIGAVNLQMEEMRQAFSNFKKYPESKKDIRTVFVYFSEKILSMVNAEWVIMRVIDVRSGHTVREDKFSRNNQAILPGKIDNRELLLKKCKLEGLSVIKSDQENLNIKACCILPVKLSGRDQEFFVKSMINQLEMMFIVFSSLNKERKNSAKSNHEDKKLNKN